MARLAHYKRNDLYTVRFLRLFLIILNKQNSPGTICLIKFAQCHFDNLPSSLLTVNSANFRTKLKKKTRHKNKTFTI